MATSTLAAPSASVKPFRLIFKCPMGWHGMVRGELYQIDDEGGNILRFTNCEKRTVSLVTFWWGEGKKCTCPDFRFNRKAKAHGCKHILACDEILRKYL